MEVFRPLRAALFIYECTRLAVLVWLFGFLGAGGEAGIFPWAVYGVPNALLPLMTLFLWRQFSRYRTYAPLYASGKCVALAAVVGFCVFFRQNMRAAFALGDADVFAALGSLLFLLAGDMFSVAGGLALVVKSRGLGEAAAVVPAVIPAGAAAGPAAEDGGT
jgi:hypothetical protein